MTPIVGRTLHSFSADCNDTRTVIKLHNLHFIPQLMGGVVGPPIYLERWVSELEAEWPFLTDLVATSGFQDVMGSNPRDDNYF